VWKYWRFLLLIALTICSSAPVAIGDELVFDTKVELVIDPNIQNGCIHESGARQRLTGKHAAVL